MAKSKTRVPRKPLTEVELELMSILWRLEGGTVNEVLAELPRERPLAYTSVSTMLRIMEQKGLLASEKVGRGHRYRPAVAKRDYEAFALSHLTGKVFDGQPVELVRRLVDSGGLSAKDLAALKRLLASRSRS